MFSSVTRVGSARAGVTWGGESSGLEQRPISFAHATSHRCRQLALAGEIAMTVLRLRRRGAGSERRFAAGAGATAPRQGRRTAVKPS